MRQIQQNLGYFKKYTMTKLYVIKNKDAGNKLGINSAISLNLVKLKSDDKNTVNKIEEEHNNIVKLLEDYNNVFNGTGKLNNHEAKLYLNENSKLVYQKMRRQS